MAQKRIQSLEKAVDILFAFDRERPYLTIKEISSVVGLPKSTCYRFMKTLKEKGVVELDSGLGKYKLCVRLLRLESAIQTSLDIVKIALPYMQKLTSISGETTELMVLSNDEAVCVEKVESLGVLRVMPDKGNVIGLHSGASGKAIMAFLSDEEQDRIIKEKGLKQYTPNTITNPELLKEHLKEIRTTGYATSYQEIYLGVKAVASPIFDFRDKIRASIAVAGPGERFNKEKINHVLSQILTAAREITNQLGGNSKKLIH